MATMESELKLFLEAFPTLKAWAKLHRKLDRIINNHTDAQRIAMLTNEVKRLINENTHLRAQITRSGQIVEFDHDRVVTKEVDV